ncbi:MAG: efflux RND transporter permease subunit [Planctomycetota bacterium]
MKVSDHAIDRPLVVMLGTVLVLLLGAWAVQHIPVERDPDVTIPYIVVTVPWPGATPADVEKQIARPLEQQLQGLDHVDWLHLNSVEGACTAVVRFLDAVDINTARQRIKDRVDLARPEFPDDAEEPVVVDVRLDSVPVVLVTVAGGDDFVALKTIAENLGDRLETLNGVSEVEVFGGLEREVKVECEPDRLATFGVTFDDVAAAIRNWHLSFPAGKTGLSGSTGRDTARDYVVRVRGEVASPDLLNDIPVAVPGTNPPVRFPLREVATIRPGFKDRESFSRFNGQPCVTCVVHRTSGVNTIDLVGRIKAEVNTFEEQLPEGSPIQLHSTQDIGKEIRGMMTQLLSSALYGAVLVFIMLVVAVGVRNSLLVAFAIPFTVALTVFALDLSGHTINAVTMFGMIVILGLVVDGAVIVGENIFRHVEEGMPPLEAAKIGIHEVGASVIVADLTTIAAFLPLLMLSGSTGDYLSPIPLVVALALAASLIVDHFTLPTLAARMMPRRKRGAPGGGVTRAAVAPRRPRDTGGSSDRGWWKRAFRFVVFGEPMQPPATPPLPSGAMPVPPSPDVVPPTDMTTAPLPGSDEHEIDGVRMRKADQQRDNRPGGVRRFIAVGGSPRQSQSGEHRLDELMRGGSGAPLVRWFRGLYVRCLQTSMNVSLLVFAVVTGAVAAGVVALFGGVVGMELMPHVDRSRFFVLLEMPVGTPLEQTRTSMLQLEDAVKAFIEQHPDEIETWVTTGGQTNSLQSDIRENTEQGPEYGKIQIELVPIDRRVRTQYEILSDLRARFHEAAGETVIVEEIYEGPPAGKPVAVRLYGETWSELDAAMRELLDIVRRTPGTRDAASDYRPTRPGLAIDRLTGRSNELGVSSAAITAATRAAIHGVEAGLMEDGDDRIDIIVTARATTCDTPDEMRQLPVRSELGMIVPLGEVATVSLETGVRKQQRRDGSKCVSVRADLVAGARLADVLREIRSAALQSPVLQRLNARFDDEAGGGRRVRMVLEGEAEERDRTFNELLIAMALGIILVTFILASYLNSLVQAGILMMTVPLGFLGVLVGLYLTGNTFNTLSFMGMVALTGIVVNDAVVLLDYTNYRRKLEPWRPVREVVLHAARTRLRPVIITTVTTVGGLLPLALNWGGGGRFWEPLAWSIIFGVSFATVLTLVVIPVAYNFLLNPDEGLQRLMKRLRPAKPGS